jgi:hypothetical protein
LHCPLCRTEYRCGFVECADCRVPLVAELPPQPEPEDHSLRLVTVFESTDSFALTLAKSALEDASIPYIVDGSDPNTIGTFLRAEIPVSCCHCRIWVPAEDESRARDLLDPLQEPPPDVGEAEAQSTSGDE